MEIPPPTEKTSIIEPMQNISRMHQESSVYPRSKFISLRPSSVKIRWPNKEVIDEASFRRLYRYFIKSQVDYLEWMILSRMS
jgi:hypothetical protein